MNLRNKDGVFRNGLTKEQRIKIYELFDKVNLSAVCRSVNVKPSVIWSVMRDESPHVDQLKTVIIEAKKQLKKKQNALKTLPI